MSQRQGESSVTEPHGPVLSEYQAKQARRGTHTFRVLIISLVLVVIAFGVLYALRAPPIPTLHTQPANTTSDSTQTPPPPG